MRHYLLKEEDSYSILIGSENDYSVLTVGSYRNLELLLFWATTEKFTEIELTIPLIDYLKLEGNEVKMISDVPITREMVINALPEYFL